ncbi:MAG: HAD-IA family hydrolase [Magnetococcales bacterium]|nr:HAD-IA family hydrolase [Magnetococcales bacterium]
MSRRFDLVIFDCDGTLVDSLGLIAHSMNLAMQEIGADVDLTQAQVADVVGLALDKAVNRLLPDSHAHLLDEAVAAYRKHFRILADAQTVDAGLFPGVHDTLKQLQASGVDMAVATGKSLQGLKRNLQEHDLSAFFTWLKTAESAPSKPHPGMVEQILAESGADPDRVLMVGDTDYDMIMGRDAGVKTCAVSFGCHDRQRLERAKPDFFVDTLSAVATLALSDTA